MTPLSTHPEPRTSNLVIGIDGNEANVINRVGSNQYAYGILTGLYANHQGNDRFIVYLKAAPVADMPKTTVWWQYRVIGPSPAWTQWRLPLDLYFHSPRPQVFYSPGHYAPRFSPIPTIVSIMDLAFLKMPQLFLKYKRGTKQLAEWTAYSVGQASRVIAISEHTKQDVIESYHRTADNIDVAYPGVDTGIFKAPSDFVIRQVRVKYQLPERYVLHLGTIQPRKNIIRLIQAFESLPPKYKTWKLVFAGQTGWLAEDIEAAIANSKVKARIKRLGFVDQQDIPALLAGAGSLVMVGIYEGFGMPPAEALACGTIPVVSTNTSLPEVVGEAGVGVDPYSVASIAHGIMVAIDLTKEQKRRRLELGKQHIKRFDWQKSAAIILNAIKKVVS